LNANWSVVRQREAGVVGVAVDVVRLDAVEALVHARVQSRPQHRRQDIAFTDVEPLFALPTVEFLAQHFGRRLIGIRTPILPAARTDVADYDSPLFVKRRDCVSIGVEKIDVVHVHVERRVYGQPLQLPLPGGVQRRAPNGERGGLPGRNGCRFAA
jgi:hypothetical protein